MTPLRHDLALAAASGGDDARELAATAARLDVRTRCGRVRNPMTATDSPVETDEQAEVRARTGFDDFVIRRS